MIASVFIVNIYMYNVLVLLFNTCLCNKYQSGLLQMGFKTLVNVSSV